MRIASFNVENIESDYRIAQRLLADKQTAFNAGVTGGSILKDIELRGLEAVQADEDAEHAEMLHWLEAIQAIPPADSSAMPENTEQAEPANNRD